MISFKTFLQEAASYPLYHATSIRAASLILQHGDVLGSTSEASEPFGLSTTRDIRTAWRFGALKNGTYGDTVVFELDRHKISQRYKIVPYNYWGVMKGITRFSENRTYGDFNEYEEKIIFKKSMYIIPYIKTIIVYSPRFFDIAPVSAAKLVNSPNLYIYTTKEWANK